MLSVSACYAAHALCHLADGRGPRPVKEIAAAAGIPSAYLAKILNQLARKGLVVAQRGVGGGVAPAPDHPLGQLSLFNLCAALEDPIVETRCMIGRAECSDERACAAHAFWAPQRRRTLDWLQSTSVADLVAFDTARAGPVNGSGEGNGRAGYGNWLS